MFKGYHYEGPLPLGSVVAHNCGAAGLFSSNDNPSVILIGSIVDDTSVLSLTFNDLTTGEDSKPFQSYSWMTPYVTVTKKGTYHIKGATSSVGRRNIGQILLALLRIHQGLSPFTEWGSLVGVRPTKLFHKIMDQQSSMKDASQIVKDILEKEYFLSPEKSELLCRIGEFQRPYVDSSLFDKRSISLYCGIPFCQTHCIYCSFPYGLWQNYDKPKEFIQTLVQDIDDVHHVIDTYSLHQSSLYMGGGTPTIVGEHDFETILGRLSTLVTPGMEFTVEAGRPDSVSKEKIKIMDKAGVNRISINPQTMQNSILKTIGRGHTVQDIDDLFQFVRRNTSFLINMDFIAGLPGQNLVYMRENMDYICTNMPENVTIHTLALKKGSLLYDGVYMETIPNEDVVSAMVTYCQTRLESLGYIPYYVYRQQYMTGHLENIGYTLPGKACEYNIRIMEERQSILSMGSGSSSKWISGGEYRQKKQHMPKNVDTYIESIDQLLEKRSSLCKSFWEGK